MRKKMYFLLPFCLFFVACASVQKEVEIKNKITQSDKYKQVSTQTPLEELKTKEDELSSNKNDLEEMNKAIMEFYSEWKDVKYVYGGNSKNRL